MWSEEKIQDGASLSVFVSKPQRLQLKEGFMNVLLKLQNKEPQIEQFSDTSTTEPSNSRKQCTSIVKVCLKFSDIASRGFFYSISSSQYGTEKEASLRPTSVIKIHHVSRERRRF